MPTRTRKCHACDTNNDSTAAECIVCNLPLRRSRVRGVRVSRVRRSRDLTGPAGLGRDPAARCPAG